MFVVEEKKNLSFFMILIMRQGKYTFVKYVRGKKYETRNNSQTAKT